MISDLGILGEIFDQYFWKNETFEFWKTYVKLEMRLQGLLKFCFIPKKIEMVGFNNFWKIFCCRHVTEPKQLILLNRFKQNS